MPILLVESIGLAKAQYELPPGIYTAGRGPMNSIVLDQETVSTVHCELEAREDGRVRVRDNGSTNGTRINGEPVTEQTLAPGDILTLGSVRLLLSMRPAAPAQSRPAPAAMGVPAAAAGSDSSFWAQIPGALRFPFREDTLIVMVVVLVLENAQLLLPGMLQFAGLVIGFVIAYYLFTTYLMIVTATIDGKDDLPSLMLGAMRLDEIKEGFLQYFLLALACLALPGIANWIPGVPGWISKVLTLGGAFYFSMAFLALIVTQSLVGLNPFFTVVSIARAPLAYLAVSLPAMIALGLEYGSSVSGQAVAGSRGLLLVIGVLVTVVDLYFLFVWARLLGLFYRCNRERLAWEAYEP